MHTQIRRVGDEVVITLDGDADLAAAPRITQALQRAIAMATDSASALTVDLDVADLRVDA